MKKVIILCSALVFDFLTCSNASAWEVDVNNVTPNNSTAAFEERLNALESIVGQNSEEVSIITNHWFQKGYWYGVGKRDASGKISGKCHPGRIGEFKEALRSIQRRIDDLNAGGPSSNHSTPSSSRRAPVSSNDTDNNFGEENAGEPSSNYSTPSSSRRSSVSSNDTDNNFGEEDAAAENFNFEDIKSVEDVNRLTPKQCQLAVINGIIDKEKFFDFGINAARDGEQRKAIDRIIDATKNEGGDVRIIDRLNEYSAKIRTLISRNPNLFKNVEFVRRIKKDLKIFHDSARNTEGGRSYLRFLIVDKI